MKLIGRSTKASKARGSATLSVAFSMPFELVDGKAPGEFRIFKAGDNPSTKGLFLFDDVSQELVMGSYAERGVPMMMDYEHQSSAEPPIEAPASAKSFVPQVRDGELWATDVVWTDRARAYLESGEYRLFSPWFSYVKQPDGRLRVTRLINVALTNNPALHNIEPLMAANDKDDDMDEMEKMKAQLKALQEKCDALATANTSLSAENASLKAKPPFLEKKDDDDEKATAALRAEVKAITGKDDLKESVGVLRSIALKAKSADESVARLTEIEAEKRDGEFTALLDAAHKDGKISPAQRKDFWEKKGRGEDKHVTVEGLAMLRDWLPSAAVQVNLKESVSKDGRGGVLRTADEKHVMARFGMTDPEEIKRFDEFRAAAET